MKPNLQSRQSAWGEKTIKRPSWGSERLEHEKGRDRGNLSQRGGEGAINKGPYEGREEFNGHTKRTRVKRRCNGYWRV